MKGEKIIGVEMGRVIGEMIGEMTGEVTGETIETGITAVQDVMIETDIGMTEIDTEMTGIDTGMTDIGILNVVTTDRMNLGTKRSLKIITLMIMEHLKGRNKLKPKTTIASELRISLLQVRRRKSVTPRKRVKKKKSCKWIKSKKI